MQWVMTLRTLLFTKPKQEHTYKWVTARDVNTADTSLRPKGNAELHATMKHPSLSLCCNFIFEKEILNVFVMKYWQAHQKHFWLSGGSGKLPPENREALTSKWKLDDALWHIFIISSIDVDRVSILITFINCSFLLNKRSNDQSYHQTS